MKKAILVLAVVTLFGLSINGQTLRQVSYKILGEQTTWEEKTREKTDYGSFVFKRKTKKDIVTRVTVTITNDHPMYDSIMDNLDYDSYRVGSMWTDFILNYEHVITAEYDNLNEARKHYNHYMNTPWARHKNVKIYKHPKKEKYIVGVLIWKRYQGGHMYYASDTNKIVASNKWKII